MCIPINFARALDLGQHRTRHAEQFEHFLVPLEGVDVEQEGAAGVRDVRNMVTAAGEVPDEPAVYRSEAELTGICLLTRARDVFEDPADLCSAEVRVENEAGLAADLLRKALGTEFVAEFGSTSVLPDDGVVDRFAGLGAGAMLISGSFQF